MNSTEPSALPPSENPNQPSTDAMQPPPFLPKLPPRTSANQQDPYGWLKWFFAQNPFYIASAILLLYAMFRLSVDPKIFAQEISQLFFNFGSFQFYELMLAGTALALVRRKILYDFSLLVCIETLFAYVPFILLSQALLIDGEMAIKLSVAASVLVVLRFSQLRKHFGGMNFPPRLLALGGVLLLINVILPMLARYVHSGSVALDRVDRMNALIRPLWLFGTPLLAGITYFLPTPRTIGSHLLQRRTFPLTALGLWVVVTAAHLYCIGYIHETAWNIALATPLLWTAAWMFYLRIGDVFEKPRIDLRNFLLVPAGAVTLLAAYQQQWSLFFTLNLLNVFIYGALVLKQRSFYAFRLMSLAMCAVLAGIPDELIARFGLGFTRSSLIGLGITGFVLLQALLSRDPSAGVLGALVAGIATAVFFHGNSYYVNVAAQIGAAFLLAHSLRWIPNVAGSGVARFAAAAIWVIHSIIWTASINVTAMWTTACFALAVFTIYFAVRAIFGIWGSRVVPCAAALVLLSGPVQRLFSALQSTPVGLLVLIASFVLFALGTLLALTRNRWQKPAHIITAEPSPE